MKKILLVLLSLAMLFSCNIGSDSDSNKDDEKKVTEPEVVTPEEIAISGGRGKALDKDGNLLGHILTMNDSEQTITIITENGYILKIFWDGSIVRESIFYTGANGTGSPYMTHSLKDGYDIPAVYEKTVFYGNSKYYIYKANASGIVEKNTTITESLSHYDGHSDNLTTSTISVAGDIVYELKTIDRATIDYPATIAQPISITFK